jgi:hypothetical protein
MLELAGTHVVGEAAKPFVSQAGIRRVLQRFATASERGAMLVINASFGEGGHQGIAVELRVTSGAREAPHINDALDAGRAKRIQEHVERDVGVTDGPDCGHGYRLAPAKMNRAFLV